MHNRHLFFSSLLTVLQAPPTLLPNHTPPLLLILPRPLVKSHGQFMSNPTLVRKVERSIRNRETEAEKLWREHVMESWLHVQRCPFPADLGQGTERLRVSLSVTRMNKQGS